MNAISRMRLIALFTIILIGAALYGGFISVSGEDPLALSNALPFMVTFMVALVLGAGVLPLFKRPKSSLQHIKAIADMSSSGMFVTDEKAHIVYANAAFLKLTGYSKDELYGRNPNILKSGKHDSAFYEKFWESLQDEGRFEGKIWDRKKNGAIYPKYIRIKKIGEAFGTGRYYYVAIQEDLTGGDQKSYISYHSRSLLPNETALKNLLENEHFKNGTPFTLFFIRIQNRSSLETAFGRENYTRLLQTYAGRVKDAVGTKGFVAEITHYTLVVISTSDKDRVEEETAMMIRLGRPLKTDDVEAFFNVNIGISQYPENGEDADTLLRNARVALDHIQYTPGQSYAMHESGLEARLKEELTVGSHLPRALENGEFHMVYQPQFDKGEIVGIEALLRWNSPFLGKVSPEVFIKVAEEGGWMTDVTQLVFKLLEKDLKKISHHMQDIRLAINISSSQLMDRQCLQGFAELNTLTGIPAEQLEIEVTEGAVIADVELIAKKLDTFKKKGIRIAIDDFGTGFSTMTHLEKIPADMLKIDKSFVSGYPDETDGNIAALVIRTAENLGIDVIAEGVETDEQKTFLESNGCTLHQGYYYSKPLPLEALMNLLGAAQ